MKTLILILSIIVPNMVSASESWFCSEESAKRSGNVMSICGIGESANDEGFARKKALTNAIEEFKIICDLSSDCANQPISIEPKRTTCAPKENGLIKCYRLIEITIGK